MALGHDKRDQSKPSAVTNLSKETELRHNTVRPSWHKHVVVGSGGYSVFNVNQAT
jgi:hypothetical protein